MPQRIMEVKRHPDGAEHRYECELLALRPHVAVVLFRHWGERSAGGFRFPKGSRTYGFFWRRRPYSLYRMTAGGRVIAHRFDVLEDCRLSRTEISYLDLLLDIWVAPDGRVQVEDEDDVAAWAQAGLLSKSQLQRIEAAKALLLRRHRTIEREAEQLLASLR